MSISIDKDEAASLVLVAAADAERGSFDAHWFSKVERLSQLCEAGVSKTHIAFLGTAMIAKAVRLDVDLFAVKPRHAGGNPGAFSARTLCHSVLVPLAADLGFSIGVTGREPLNNQPYFRMTRLGDDTPVHPGGRVAFDYTVQLVEELRALSTQEEARAALAAFIAERRRYQPRYVVPEGEATVTPEALSDVVRAFVSGDESVDGPVEALGLGVEHVDEAPHQALAFVGELGSVGCDALGEDADRFPERRDCVFAIPDVAAVELVALWGCAEELHVVADGCGGGLRVSVEAVHGVLH